MSLRKINILKMTDSVIFILYNIISIFFRICHIMRFFMKDIIVINSIDFRGSICDGPGIRTVLFLQGCKRYCFNCHNPQTWDMNNGIKYKINELTNIIIEKSPFKKITISGGEPLLQMEVLEKFLVLLKAENFNITLYTGFDKKDVPKNILNQLNYLKTGEYKNDLRTTITPYVGSTNQIFEKIS